MHRISVASDAPALVLALPAWSPAAADLARQIADAAAESCPGVDIQIGYLNGAAERLADVLAAGTGRRRESAGRFLGRAAHGRRARERSDAARAQDEPQAVVVPLLAGPHPGIDEALAAATSAAQAPGSHAVMLAGALGPHPLLAGALHDRLSEAGLARASRARGLSIAAGSTGIIVVADRGPQAVADAGVTALLLASRLAVPAAPASLGDRASIQAALQRLREAGATHLAIAPCVIGPETDPAEIGALSSALGAPCAPPLGAHPAVAQLVAVRYGEALARISATGH